MSEVITQWGVPPEAKAQFAGCESEPIHVPGAIQPHGVLIAVRPADLTILQVSANVASAFGRSPEGLLGRPLGDLYTEAQSARLSDHLARHRAEGNPLRVFTGAIGEADEAFHVVAHLHDGVLIVEHEPARNGEAHDPELDPYLRARDGLIQLEATPTVRAYCDHIAALVHDLTGFRRVLVFAFEEDGTGSVIAEIKPAAWEAFLGKRFPASDVPRQARRLFALTGLRLTPDLAYTPVPLVPALNPDTGRPLDLTYASLRHSSRMCTEYKQNMGHRSSLAIAIPSGVGELWGLISCFDDEPRRVPYEVRAACEFLGKVFALQIKDKVAQEEAGYRREMAGVREALVAGAADASALSVLADGSPSVLDLLDAQGAAVLGEGRCLRLGDAPREAEIHALGAWLAGAHGGDTLYATDAAPAEITPTTPGVLALRVSFPAPGLVIWFRPEVTRTVDWAGDPQKPMRMGPHGPRLTPRGSFALWRQAVEGRARPWLPVEIEGARAFERELSRLAQVRAEAERRAREDDAAQALRAHDLREPLRGIRRYTDFVLEDYGDRLDPEGQQRLETVLALTQRMDDLIGSMLHLARVGSEAIDAGEIDLDAVVRDVVSVALRAQIEQTHTEVRLAGPLGVARCDRALIGDVFANLVGNAIKYNDKAERWVEIGARPGSPRVFFVRDNGIGIAPEHTDRVFQMFRRLHPRDAYGGGTGVGLSLVRKIIERHRGKVWVESTPGGGSTFAFTLGPS